MNISRTLLSTSIVVLLASTASCVKADFHYGSDLPALGDVAKAGNLVKAGDAAAAAGRVQEAITDYQEAIAASPFYENAALGLARCAAAEGDYTTSIAYYRSAIYGHSEDYNIDELTEYILVLSQASQGQEAVSVYNHVVGLCQKGYSIRKMEITPPTFLLDGSDYNSAELQAMTHLIRAMNSDSESEERKLSEIQKAAALAPNSPLVYFYNGILLSRENKSGAKRAFQEALNLENGTNTKIIKKWIALSK